MNSFMLGPWIVSGHLIGVLAGFVAALVTGALLGRGRDSRIVDRLIAMALTGIVAARLVFVARHAGIFVDAPLTALDIRDRGFDLVGGLAGMALYGLIAGLRQPATRRPLVGAVVAGCLVIMASEIGIRALFSSPASGLPDSRLVTRDGHSTSLAAIAAETPGRATVVNLWASWCPPCRAEMPMLARAQRERDDILFIFVNEDRSRAAMQRFLDRADLALAHIVIDPGQTLARRLDVPGYPTTLFYDRQGRLVSRQTGRLSKATLADRLSAITP